MHGPVVLAVCADMLLGSGGMTRTMDGRGFLMMMVSHARAIVYQFLQKLVAVMPLAGRLPPASTTGALTR